MESQYIELLSSIRDDAYKLGYMDGQESGDKRARADLEGRCNMLRNELALTTKRANWLQNKYYRMKENYEGQINNLQNKIKHYEELTRGGADHE